jgi:hypothetical protein
LQVFTAPAPVGSARLARKSAELNTPTRRPNVRDIRFPIPRAEFISPSLCGLEGG